MNLSLEELEAAYQACIAGEEKPTVVLNSDGMFTLTEEGVVFVPWKEEEEE